MRSYKVNKELFDDAVFKEHRIIERFFDIEAAYDFKERYKIMWFKIQNDIATQEELLEVASLIKHHN